MDFEKALKRVEAINVNEIAAKAVKSVEAEVIDLNTSQLSEGLTNEGKAISPEYQNKAYADFKQFENSKPPKGVPDLKLEGDFYEGFFVEVKSGGLMKAGDAQAWIDSSDEKTAKLEKKYDNIFGIAPKNRREFLELIAPEIKRQILEAI